MNILIQKFNFVLKLNYYNKTRILLFKVLILVILFTSCGLSNYIYLYPPLAGSNLYFTHDSRNNKDPDFLVLGYDIYYRIYNSTNEDDSVIRNNMINDANTYFTASNVNSLISRNFNSDSPYRPVFYDSDVKGTGYSSNESPPVLPVDNSQLSNTQFTVNIILNNTNISNPYIETAAPYGSDTLPEKIFFKRYITKTTGKDFDTFDVGDADIPDDLISNNNVFVAFFVISYGSTVDLYSLTSDTPLFIGYTELNY